MGTSNEFVYWIAEQGHVDELLGEHVSDERGSCAACRRPWPCGMRRRAEDAMALRAKSATGGLRLTETAVIWRAEVFRDDGRWSRAEWFGRADYPDREAARIWLTTRLETLRDPCRPPDYGVLWGELTAGQLDPGLSAWRPTEEWGATATAFLWSPRDPIKWDADEWFSWATPPR